MNRIEKKPPQGVNTEQTIVVYAPAASRGSGGRQGWEWARGWRGEDCVIGEKLSGQVVRSACCRDVCRYGWMDVCMMERGYRDGGGYACQRIQYVYS